MAPAPNMADRNEREDCPCEADEFARYPAVLTSAEAAAMLRVGVKEVRRIVDAGELPAARIGPRRVIRIRKAALLAYLSGHRESTTSHQVLSCDSANRRSARRT